MGASVVVSFTERVETTECCVCSVIIYMSSSLKRDLLENHKSFYCINGHKQHFIGESEAEKLRKELEAQKRRTQMALDDMKIQQARRLKAEEKAEREEKKRKRVEKRVHNGVCPHCNRHFTNLEQHMHTKHAEPPVTEK